MEQEIINNIKSLGIDMISSAGSGHPGIVLGAAPILYTLYAKHLNVTPNDPKWLNRDRFVLSAGHGSALLYSVLFMAGYLSLEDLKRFRQIDSRTPGHPEYGVTPGVEMSTGPLGQGIASAVGLALAEKILEEKYKTSDGKSLFSYHVYTLCGDGDLMEGISSEAASFAGTLKLNNLIVLYDSNHVSLDGTVDHVFTENVCARFEAFGWDTITVKDGTSVSEIDKAISKAKKNEKPTLIEIHTIIGNGSVLEGTNKVHGSVLEKNDVLQLKEKLGLSEEPFYVVPNASNAFQKEMIEHTKKSYEDWSSRYQNYVETNGVESLNFLFEKETPIDLTLMHYPFVKDEKIATRASNATVMNMFAKELPNFLTGSADLFSSVKNYLSDSEKITSENYLAKNIEFGVREHAMGAILNGLALSHFKVSGSTFLTFSDYVKPAIRMSSLMNLPVTYIFSHDSIAIGSDGPTHQPVEQLSTLRSMPNINVYRPADANEVIGSWNEILKEKHSPNALILSKQEELPLETTDASKVKYGAYIVRKEQVLHGVIISTGDDLHTALRIANNLYQKYKLDLRVVSMPCMEKFLMQEKEYQDLILPKGVRTVVIEASSSFGWEKFVYNDSYLFTIDHFGASGSKSQILKKFHYDETTLEERMKKLFL